MPDPLKRRARNARYYQSKRGSIEKRKQHRPFIGVDGEGGGTDSLGRQHFLLLRGGEHELFKNNIPLTTRKCLDFILGLPASAILVGYFFTYDATQILRDLPEERLRRLYTDKEKGAGFSPYTFWKGYAIDFVPRQYFRVALLDKEKLTVVPGSARTVNEVGGFFQKSFVEAIKDWKVGDAATVDMIARQKELRETFATMSDTERLYCAAECRLLAELMERLRETCVAAGIEPKQWRGAGWLAARLHELHETQKRKDRVRSMSLEATAVRAYYGGRFEVTTIGKIEGPVYEYDINSAYPAAMLELPCPFHTRWKKIRSGQQFVGSGFAVNRVAFQHSDLAPLCHLPVRRKGRLYWPRMAEGTYWSPELNAAIDAGTEIVEWKGGYYAETTCGCSSHQWVRELYELRKRIGKATEGYPIKLGINGLYGKYAQRQGAAPWRDYIAAGLITAITRAKLIRAYRSDPSAIVYIATDGLFSRRPLDVEIDDGLGQWETKLREGGLFVVQPGIYWSADGTGLPKTRGIPRSRIIAARDQFENVWQRFIASDTLPQAQAPNITVPVTTFIGHRLALSWGRPEAAGSWIQLGNGGRSISFDWQAKRAANVIRDGMSLRTMPREGSRDLLSEPYDPKLLTELDEQSMIDEAFADYEPWGNSGE